ncbi:MAG: hypothetical protein KBC11_02300 [Candidatus Pacebacteria bacterium]|nr:hypothetical protein [Candidatus Paceibacterota bacterium]
MRLHLSSFFSFLKKNLLPNKEDIEILKNSSASKSKIFLILSFFLSAILFLNILMYISATFSQEVPDYGGFITEGVIGAPKYINPLLATTETDLLLTDLVYAGLMKKNDDNTLSPYLAKSCESSPDGKSYQCILPESAVFSDKSIFTSDDVVFTFETKQKLVLEKDPTSNWSSITIAALDLRTVVIKTSDSPESLKDKLTLGIVPKALWGPVPLDRITDSVLNMNPVGIGPFVLDKVKIINTIPTEVTLNYNHKWTGQRPFVDKIIVHSYANQLDLKSGLKNGSINSTSSLRGISIDETIEKDFVITTIPNKKVVGLFINKKELGSKNEKFLKSIEVLVDKKNIVDTIENGYGILPSSEEGKSPTNLSQTTQITIAVQKDTDLIKTAELLSTNLKDFGIISTVKVFDQGLFNDRLDIGEYSYILGTNIDDYKEYQLLLPLYTKSIVQINSKDIHVRTPQLVESPHESLREVISWYKNTDFVWKWFIDKK